MRGSSSYASGSGATKSGSTNWSRVSRVSRTRPRSEDVRRNRQSRTIGYEFTLEWYAAGASGGRGRRRLGHRLALMPGLDPDLAERLVDGPLLQLDPL